MITLSVTETNYQLEVVKGANLNIYKIHWDSRSDIDSRLIDDEDISVVNGRLSFLLVAVKKLMTADVVVVGDFRSTVQLLIILMARVLQRKIILSEDGLIAQVADKYNFRFSAINDPGIRFWKILILVPLSSWLNKLGRLTTTPDYLKFLGKENLIFDTSKPNDITINEFSDRKNSLLYLGSNFTNLGITIENIISSSESLSNNYRGFDNYIFILHPADPANTTLKNELQRRGWKVHVGLSELSAGFYGLIAYYNSTAVLSNSYLSTTYLYTGEPEYLGMPNGNKELLNMQHTVIKEILALKINLNSK